MGSTLNRYQSNRYDYTATGPSLKNRTFKIQGHMYTLIDRLGGGAFGSVWSAVSPDGKY
jgi:hypothetical protein